MRKALDITEQLKRHFKELSLDLHSCGDDLTALRKALTAGLFCNAARRQPDGQYRVLTSGQLVHIHPSSVTHGKRPETIVFTELVKTSRQYARQVTVIDAAWLPELAPQFFSAQATIEQPKPVGVGVGAVVAGNGVAKARAAPNLVSVTVPAGVGLNNNHTGQQHRRK